MKYYLVRLNIINRIELLELASAKPEQQGIQYDLCFIVGLTETSAIAYNFRLELSASGYIILDIELD